MSNGVILIPEDEELLIRKNPIPPPGCSSLRLRAALSATLPAIIRHSRTGFGILGGAWILDLETSNNPQRRYSSTFDNCTKAQMFCLSEIEHTLRLPPHLLNLPLHVAIKGELEGLFVDKVIANLGLCISVYDIRTIDGGFIFAGDGASTYTVCFQLVMFRPFVGEVIAAKLRESDANGLRLSLGFFDDIYIPVHLMPNPSHLEADPVNKKQIRWVWEFGGENFPIDGMDEIRFRVQSIKYPSIPVQQENSPVEQGKQSNPSPVEQGKQSKLPPVEQGKQSNPSPVEQEKLSNQVPVEQGKQSKPPAVEKEKKLKPFAPMVVTGSLDADGLGPISWWV